MDNRPFLRASSLIMRHDTSGVKLDPEWRLWRLWRLFPNSPSRYKNAQCFL